MRAPLRLLLALPLALASGASLPLGATACSGKAACNDLRARAEDLKHAWASCDPASADPNQCWIVGGISADCTGVFACSFGVNVLNLRVAEQAALEIAQDSADCHACAQPTCLDAQRAACDPYTRKCIVFTASSDAGTAATSDGGS